MAALLGSTQFLNNEQAVVNLLDHLRQLSCQDTMNFHTLMIYLIVLSAMTCHPERLIIERLRAEIEVWEKTKLIDLLRVFYQPEVFVALMEQFEDTREIRCEHCGRQRVCDKAYTGFIAKLESLEFIKYRQFGDVYGSTPEQQARYFAEVNAYWKANKASILQEIPKRKTPPHMLWRAMKRPTATPPTPAQ